MSFAVAQYRSATVETASPVQIVVQLYDGALRFMRQAQEGMQDEGQRAAVGRSLSKAHAVVAELQSTLDNRHAPELCAELDRLYEFVLFQITQANIEFKPEHLEGPVKVMTELRAAWAELAGRR